jgi:predicted nuclease of predicted toxin-antitoxin system
LIRALLDNDVAGFQELLAGTVESTGWNEYELIEFITLDEIGLDRDTSDREIWRWCQLNSCLLLTANRNQKDLDSLQLTIREENTPYSLPVVTISNQKRLHNTAYREVCVQRLMTIVLELSNHLGTGRVYIP